MELGIWETSNLITAWRQADVRLLSDCLRNQTQKGYGQVQEGPRVYKLLSCQSVNNSFDSEQFISKELCYMGDRPNNGKLIRNGEWQSSQLIHQERARIVKTHICSTKFSFYQHNPKQGSQVSKQTHCDKNTDPIQTHFNTKYRPFTDQSSLKYRPFKTYIFYKSK